MKTHGYSRNLFLVTLVGLSISGQAVVLEDFETDFSNYTVVAGPSNAVQSTLAAHDGTFGANFSSFGGYYYDLNIRTSAGHRYRAFVRQRPESVSGGLVLGVKATTQDSLVGTINRVGIGLGYSRYGQYTRLRDQSFFPTKGVWYQLELEWLSNGVMTVNTYTENGVWLAGTIPFHTDELGSGGLHIRGDGNWDMDTITETPVPEPSLVLMLTTGVMVLFRKMRSKE